MRSLLLFWILLPRACFAADEIVMKGGQKIEGLVEAMKDGDLHVGVPAGYMAGLPAYKLHKVRFQNVRSIKCDGRDDFFAIVKKSEEVIDARVYELSHGKFQMDGHAPIPASNVKALVPTKPNQEGNK